MAVLGVPAIPLAFRRLKRIQFRIERVGIYRKPVLLLVDFEGVL